MMKKHYLSLAITIALTACGGSSTEEETKTTPIIQGDTVGTDSGTGIIGGSLSVSANDSFVVMTDSETKTGEFSIDSAGNWQFEAEPSNAALLSLVDGESLTEEIVVTTKTGIKETITVTVTGSDDAPIIGTGEGIDSASIDGSSTVPVTGKLTIIDPDADQSFFEAQTKTAGTYGEFSIIESGEWSYLLNTSTPLEETLTPSPELKMNPEPYVDDPAGVLDIFTVISADGTSHEVLILVTGTISLGNFTDGLIEGAASSTEGIISIINNGVEETFITQLGVDATYGNYGEFFLFANGEWNYSVNNSATELQALSEGETLTETFTVETESGLTQTVTVVITGDKTQVITPTAAQVSGDFTGDVTEDFTSIASGSLTIVDPDEGEASFIAQEDSNIASSNYGKFTIDVLGNWQYDLNNYSPELAELNANDIVTDSFDVTTIDGTTETILITINGTDEASTLPTPDENNKQYVSITDTANDTSGQLRYKHDGEAIEKGRLSVSFFKESYTTSEEGSYLDAYIGLYDTTSSNVNAIADLRIHEGTLEIRNSDALSVGSGNLPFTLDEWHTVEFTWDSTSANDIPTVTFSLDGGTPITFPSPTEQGAGFAGVSLLKLKLGTTSSIVPNSSFGIDDLKLYEEESGINLVFEDDFETYAENTYLDNTNNPSTPYDNNTIEAIVVAFDENTSQPEPTAAVISGDFSGTAIKDTTLKVTGDLGVVDPDSGEEGFIEQISVNTNYGYFSIDDTGYWEYFLENSNTDVLALGSLDTLTDSLLIEAIDGTAAFITITIEGAAEAVNQYAAITDTISTDAGELRYKHGSTLEAGKLSVSFYKESNSVDEDGTNKGSYIALYGDSTSTDHAVIDLRIKNGIFEVRNNDALLDSLAFQQDAWHDVEITWDSSSETELTSITLAIDGSSYGPFLSSTTQLTDAGNPLDLLTDGVKVVAFKVGDTAAILPNTSYGIDDIKLYSDQAGTIIAFEDDFESYSVGTSLDGSPYNSATSEAVVAQSGSALGPISPEGSVILPSATGIELVDWYLSVPTSYQNKTNDKNDDGVYSASADSIDELDLADDYTDNSFFYGIEEADGDKGIVMICPSRGPTTSENTYYTRVELREMLSRGTNSSTSNIDNNWVFSSAPSSAQADAAGIDGELNVTLAINHVTTTYGEDLSQVKDDDKDKSKSQFEYQVGRVVIGQIHASSDEPIRLYYRKLPSHTKGSIYYYHEPTEGDEVLVNLIGAKDLDDSDAEPTDGIALDEKFSYTIKVTGNDLDVTITREDTSTVVAPTFDMSASGFDTSDEWHYFKVGLYHLNNTAADDDYVQATFYDIRNSHDGYAFSE